MADSSHRVTIETVDNRGRNFLIGLAVLFLLYRIWVTGSLLHAIGFATGSTENAGGYSSVTGVLLPILVQVIVVIGAVAAALATGFWAVLWDFGSGIYEMLASWRARNAAVASATEAAKQEALSEIRFASGPARPLGSEIPRTESGEPITLLDMADAIQAVADEIKLLKSSYEKTAQATYAELAEVREKVKQAGKAETEPLPLFDAPKAELVELEAEPAIDTERLVVEIAAKIEAALSAKLEQQRAELEEQIAAVHKIASRPRTAHATRQIPAAPKASKTKRGS